MKFWHYLTGLAAVIFCGTSLVFTVSLFWSIPGSVGGQWVAGLTAAALELCKFSFAPLGLWLRAQGRAIGYLVLALWPLLVAISIFATVGFLTSHAERQQQLNTRGSLEYQTLQQQLDSIDQQIATLNGVIATDAVNGFRKRAIETAAQLEKWESRRTEVLAEIQTMRASASTSARATFVSLAALTNEDATQLQHSGFLALAIITDVVGLVALLAFNSVLTPTTAVQPLPQQDKRRSERAEHRRLDHTRQVNRSTALSPLQAELAERIRTGEFGQRPVLRKINREVRGGNQVVKPVFEFLQRTGELKRDSQGFALAE